MMSVSPLIMALFMSFVGALVMGSLLFYAESGVWNDNEGRFLYADGKPR